MNQRPLRIGVDTGGTFTDLVYLDPAEADGATRLRVFKLRSTPADPSEAILSGIRKLAGQNLGALHLEITHGSTVATNAVLERKGARVALLTSAGFEDVLRIGRQARPELYNFMVRRSPPLVSPQLTFGLQERLAASGEVLLALDDIELNAMVETLRTLQIESVALCFLHSYANPVHEQKVASVLRQSGLRVSASYEILPEYREYERWSTTVVNAYVAPLMARYLHRLQEGLEGSALRIMQSNGGCISAASASDEAVQTILSGPAAGVVGAQAVAAASGVTRIITLDMGGTSTDVSLLDGAISTTSESLVGDLPVRLPVLDIHTVGAGGGSVAWIDTGGSLRVGPRSAGADPGPVCFGKGDHLTVTDANLLLGRLDPEYFLGGSMPLDLARTQNVAQEFAGRLDLSTQQLAEGMLRIANANMERAVRVVSVQRGFDPRDFALLAFGGAGGLHACDLADLLEIRTVLIPQYSGVLSALGMLLADVVKNYSVSVLQSTDTLAWSDLREKVMPLVRRAQADLVSEGFAPSQQTLSASLAMRYRGQAFEIDVPLQTSISSLPLSPDAATITPVEIRSIVADFHRLHQKLYGYANSSRATEIVQLRLRSSGCTQKPLLSRSSSISDRQPSNPEMLRPTIFSGHSVVTPVYHRDKLAPGMGAEGPAMIITGESTNIIPPGWSWKLDAAGTLVATSSAIDRSSHAY